MELDTEQTMAIRPQAEAGARSLYIHIPFCASRCFYCDFTTYVAPAAVRNQYLAALKQELDLLAPLASQPLATVFFGGGTPTLLDSRQWDDLLTHLEHRFAIESDAEITVEANPGTVDLDKLRVLRQHGVNRISFGAQTFNDRLLLAIGRLHDSETVLKSVELAQQAGFERINVDLMFGLPEQSLADVEASLRTLVKLGVEHVSAYWLKVEPGTPFAEWLAKGMLPLPGEDVEADMYHLVRHFLREAGYVLYEISNFAKPGGEARHNLVYWRNQPYLAAGVGAHGYVHHVRYENVRSLLDYAQALAQGRRPIADTHTVSAAEAAEDTMMLGLRLAEGVSDERFRRQHGCGIQEAFGPIVNRLVADRLLFWQDGALRLMDSAWPVANAVFEQFIGVSPDVPGSDGTTRWN
jgi:oxygen-independent coproporphyrinogen-3 oxidase